MNELNCQKCGDKFLARASNAKYCNGCKGIARRKATREAMKRIRSKTKLIFSFDDYSPLNYRLAELIKRYGFVKNTVFYIGPVDKKQIRGLHSQGFEIGNHTYNHTILKDISPDKVKYEIELSNEVIKSITGYKPTKFCWPRGRFDNVSKEIIGKHFKEARTTKVFNYKEPEDPLETGTTIHFSYPRKEYNGIKWLSLAKYYYRKAKRVKNGRFELWGHANECEKFGEWDNLEKFLKHIRRYR